MPFTPYNSPAPSNPLVTRRRRAPVRSPAALLALAVAAVAVLFAVPAASASGPLASSRALVGAEQVLFRSGVGGYGCYRIPALVKTKAGSLLAFAEGRKSPTCADRGDIDLVMRRSTNDGRTWGPAHVVLEGGPDDPTAPYTRGNPAPVVDRESGSVFLLSTSNEATPTGLRLPWVQRSDDDGVSWSRPRALPTFSGANNGWFATGPSHGVQLTEGAHAGRLVVGAHQNPASATRYAGVLYSDDHGATWRASSTANSYVAGSVKPGEVSVTELPGGRVYLAARNEIGGSANHRTRAVSTDGGTTVPASTVVPGLITPEVQGSALTLRQTYQRTPGDTMIFSAPSDPSDRKLMKIRYSIDQGTTWTAAPNGLISNDRASYSDLAELDTGEIGLVNEGGPTNSADEIRFNVTTPGALGVPGTFTGKGSPQKSPTAGRTSPDAGPDANDAYLQGDATLGSGRFGQGLVLDGTGDYADVPYAKTLDPGAGDFTYAMWFKYAATTASKQQALFWAYGQGAGKPQVWLRTQPADDRLYAWVQGGGGGARLTLSDPSAAVAFGDDQWHHAALVRTGARIRLTVDGTVTATATGVAGSVTDAPQNGVEGIRIGAKSDSAASDAFGGSVDEFRFYRSALTDSQLAQVRANATTLDTDAATRSMGARLPFQVIDTAVVPERRTITIEDDVSGHCASGTLLGGAHTLVTGRIGSGAASVDRTHPGTETGFSPTLDVGSGDFTYTLWFRYAASPTTADQALVWAYGSGGSSPQLWVRAQPGQDRLYAWVQTDTSTAAVALPDTTSTTAYGDDAWHLMTLTRSTDKVTLGVDARSPVTVGGLTGSLTPAQGSGQQGVRVGSKLDGTSVLTGDVDEFRVYHRALSTAEIASVAGSAAGSSGSYPADPPALWWSFEDRYGAKDVVRPVAGPATPDSTVHCGHGFVRGDAATVPGKFGNALGFDGVDDAVDLPYGAATALGSADFTVSTWLKYAATSGSPDQVLLWAYGTGTSERQIWLRAQPSQDRLYAAFETDTATTVVAAVDASAASGFGDGAWHQVALERSGGQLLLIVDGATLGSSAVPAGAVTVGDTYAVDGFRLGAEFDGTDALTGALDEFRITRKALSADELTALRTENRLAGTATSTWLPFQVITGAEFARM
ncbi:sialidase family protein [Streptomyces sp. CBMA152]|uniref:sialidase family protein n=1 Tax=Streptomyces sp. CBMA152 TaxID=1896312 RepID=UPI001660C96C|nr:sialidase family protein [Streptomyces sp. CBMA152]